MMMLQGGSVRFFWLLIASFLSNNVARSYVMRAIEIIGTATRRRNYTSSCGPFIQKKTKARPLLLAMMKEDNYSDENKHEEEENTGTIFFGAPSVTKNEKKSKTRLAQLAEDWLEDEEEEGDELLQYWERFDAKQVVKAKITSTIDTNNGLTTEERLERYFDSRGINKQKEKDHAMEIENAIDKAQKATTSSHAIAVLQEVRPWLQINTRLGGTALVELAIALWQCHDEREQRQQQQQQQQGVNNASQKKDSIKRLIITNSRDEALLLCQELLGNPHVNQRVRQLIKMNGPPKRQPATNLWNGFFTNSGGWW